MGTWYTSVISILMPTKREDHAQPEVQVAEPVAMPARQKYSARRPRIAKAFDANTMNGSRHTARIAGIESTANTTSVVSIRIEHGEQRRGQAHARFGG